MYVNTNSTQVWKRMADENQQSAKYMARISVALAVLLVAVGAYALSANARYSELCSTIESSAASGENLASNYCG